MAKSALILPDDLSYIRRKMFPPIQAWHDDWKGVNQVHIQKLYDLLGMYSDGINNENIINAGGLASLPQRDPSKVAQWFELCLRYPDNLEKFARILRQGVLRGTNNIPWLWQYELSKFPFISHLFGQDDPSELIYPKTNTEAHQSTLGTRLPSEEDVLAAAKIIWNARTVVRRLASGKMPPQDEVPTLLKFLPWFKANVLQGSTLAQIGRAVEDAVRKGRFESDYRDAEAEALLQALR